MKKGGVSFDEFASDDTMLAERELWWNALPLSACGPDAASEKPRRTHERKPHRELDQERGLWKRPTESRSGRVTISLF